MTSLRLRLMFIILVPMLFIAATIVFLRYELAVANANEQFDRTLTALTMAVARDLENSAEGDGISSATAELLREALGGDIFYHGAGVGGYFIAGYAYPPATPKALKQVTDRLVFFNGRHSGQPVRVARLSEPASIESTLPGRPAMSGNRVVTVWQPTARIDDYVWISVKQTMFAVFALIATVGLSLWVSIRLGLRPLTRLERSVSRRSPEDLTPITDAVPREVSTLVERINELFEQVSEALAGRERFISNAAHQLKNPVSGLVLMSEAALNAPDDATRRERAGGVVVAAKSLMRFSNQMLSLERARSFDKGHTLKVLDLNNVVLKACERLASMLLSQGIAINFDRSVNPIYVRGDALLLQEAVTNLVSNATNHAGTKNRAIDIRTFVSAGSAVVAVRDYGVGFPTHAIDGEGKLTYERFASLDAENGSGLGLPIVKEIVSKHTGRLDLLNRTPGAEVQLVLPVVAAPLRG